MKSIYSTLCQQFLEVIVSLYAIEYESIEADIAPAMNPAFGDYQFNGAMKLSKRVQKSPRDVAAELVHEYGIRFGTTLLERLEIAGPGFINLTIATTELQSRAQLLAADDRCGLEPLAVRQRIVVDFSSPNIAKEMHVGHLRSTIIGDAIARYFEFAGHDVVRLNHLGDWGTSFGMLIAYIQQHQQEYLATLSSVSLTQLVEWYRAAKVVFDNDPVFKKDAQLAVVALQSGDAQSLAIWRQICLISQQAYQEIYDRLQVALTDRGESFYNPFLEPLVAEFEQKGLITVSEGAKAIFLDGFVTREGQLLPLIVQKSDAGFNYATTDLAAIKHRITVEKADRIIYVTDAGQAQHFQMIFQAAVKAGILNHARVSVHHVPFGLVLGPDGKKFRTRSGETERLIDLLDAAEQQAGKLIEEKNPAMSADEKNILARKLSIAAVKYADLSCHRVNDYVFSYDRMLKFEGNTAPFILYSYVRTESLLRRMAVSSDELMDYQLTLVHHSERALALRLLQFPQACAAFERELLPNRLTDYLYQVACDFNAFFRDCRVEGDPQQQSRLLLTYCTGRVLKTGLQILGIPTVERM